MVPGRHRGQAREEPRERAAASRAECGAECGGCAGESVCARECARPRSPRAPSPRPSPPSLPAPSPSPPARRSSPAPGISAAVAVQAADSSSPSLGRLSARSERAAPRSSAHRSRPVSPGPSRGQPRGVASRPTRPAAEEREEDGTPAPPPPYPWEVGGGPRQEDANSLGLPPGRAPGRLEGRRRGAGPGREDAAAPPLPCALGAAWGQGGCRARAGVARGAWVSWAHQYADYAGRGGRLRSEGTRHPCAHRGDPAPSLGAAAPIPSLCLHRLLPPAGSSCPRRGGGYGVGSREGVFSGVLPAAGAGGERGRR